MHLSPRVANQAVPASPPLWLLESHFCSPGHQKAGRKAKASLGLDMDTLVIQEAALGCSIHARICIVVDVFFILLHSCLHNYDPLCAPRFNNIGDRGAVAIANCLSTTPDLQEFTMGSAHRQTFYLLPARFI